jgi:hypothetical protein
MTDKLNTLKEHITSIAANPKFIHHKWFVKWHLEIVERIALELCEAYKEADKNLVLGLVWIHDYAKIIDFDNEHDFATMMQGKDLLAELGFDEAYIEKLMAYLVQFESYMSIDIATTPIEVQIASSADAAAHMVGPFFPLYWYENPGKSIPELLESNTKKLQKDWERKITLPEIRKQFAHSHKFLMAMFGKLPEKLL